jgi:hypothetical protein
MIDTMLYETLRRQATAGAAVTVTPQQAQAILDEVEASRAARSRERALVAALKLVEFGLVSMESTAPACPACRSARGMGHTRSCPVGSALAGEAVRV